MHALYHEQQLSLVDGYAPFCKYVLHPSGSCTSTPRHLFVPNFCDVEVGQVRITDDNRHHLVSGYVQRRPEELAVLSRYVRGVHGCIYRYTVRVRRWFPREQVPPPRARYLDLILYSREQLLKEYQDMPSQVWHTASSSHNHHD